MSDSEIETLAADIKARGLLFPATLYGALMLDGRNRQLACERIGVPLQTVEYKGDDPIGFVISANKERRHLSRTQVNLIAETLATLKHGSNQYKRTDFESSKSSLAETARQVAEQLDADPRAISDVRR
jgi:hypothetical protein